ncbi:uncharacterized protein VTP21DRAFT_7457 [Calcarisporiella thermophila]|uniref:uncharacterized protein n=1 Tax=Calcarisporiella thermophila TaxID=911321 RepID=UPI00374239E1
MRRIIGQMSYFQRILHRKLKNFKEIKRKSENKSRSPRPRKQCISTQETHQHASTEGSLLALLSPVPIRERHQWTPADEITDTIGHKTPYAPESILTSEERQVIWDNSPPYQTSSMTHL